MADDRMAVLETVRKAIADGDVDFLREGVRLLAQAVMEAEVTVAMGQAGIGFALALGGPGELGYRERRWDTRTIDLAVLRVRDDVAESPGATSAKYDGGHGRLERCPFRARGASRVPLVRGS